MSFRELYVTMVTHYYYKVFNYYYKYYRVSHIKKAIFSMDPELNGPS